MNCQFPDCKRIGKKIESRYVPNTYMCWIHQVLGVQLSQGTWYATGWVLGRIFTILLILTLPVLTAWYVIELLT